MILSSFKGGPATGVAVIAALAIAGCGDDSQTSAPGPTVVAGTTQVADLARNVAGDRADVVGILSPNSDPHDYEPLPSHAESLIEASLVLKAGGDLDLWLDELVESSGTDAEVISLIDSVETIEAGAADEDEHASDEAEPTEIDPHWWQSPANAATAVEVIREALIETDPGGRADYERNADRYLSRIEQLDGEIAACFAEVPAAQRKLVTSHDALGYFADRYGLEVVGATIPALTTQAQPSAGETAELVELIEAQEVNVVFPEIGVSPALEQAIASETGAEIGPGLYADSLGPGDSPGGTYLGSMAANAEAMVEGFSGGEITCEIAA